ncbi:MAG: hypothetical protein F4Y39_03425 [Gemmatimonadetes bacterium]|nr:hypothetical protein [Gemmatimonadota bacterium]MYF75418.1 hypothetical protein [Gemmatimonadota bacterium]MYK53494.1 hypothetical protein [Gemmatimonadota bacterium]
MSEFQSVQRKPEPLRPDTFFTHKGEPASFSVLDFWIWMASDVLNNILRGMVAEYIVSQATGACAPVRVEWDSVDIKTPKGVKIEVKSAAYLQSWPQKKPSAISFNIAKKRPWDPETNQYGETRVRNADVYVFCLLTPKDGRTVNPLELTQWEFYILPTSTLDTSLGNQKTVSLSRLKELGAVALGYDQIRNAVLEAYGDGRKNI